MAHRTMALLLALAATAIVASSVVDAHAGHFHLYPDTPSSPRNNYIRYSVGTCSSWTDLSNSGYTVTGGGTIWTYLYYNCTDRASTAFEFNITVNQANGAPLANTYIAAGYAQNVTCGATNGSRSIYIQDPSLEYDDENMIWFHNISTSAQGGINGNAANSIIARSMANNGAVESDSLASFVFYLPSSTAVAEDDNNLPTGLTPIICCNAALTPKPPASFYTQGQPCNVPPSPSPSTAAPVGASQSPPVAQSPPPRPGAAAMPSPSWSLFVSAFVGLVVLLAALSN